LQKSGHSVPFTTAADRAGAPKIPFSSALARLRQLVLVFLVGGLGLLAACADGRGGNIPYDVQFKAPDRPTALTLDDDYRISPLDTLKISIFQVADLSGDYEVDLTGHIALPLLGNVKAVDMTTAQLDQKLTDALGARYLQNPDVSVGVKASSTRVVTVDGSVNQPGVFPINGQMTLLQVVAMARGTNDTANPRRVAIFRQIDGQRQAAAFDLVSIRRGTAEDPRIYSGDIVVVDGSSIKKLQREILSTIPVLSIFNPLAL
jgi:polysaccharide biosynthesis/export protein